MYSSFQDCLGSSGHLGILYEFANWLFQFCRKKKSCWNFDRDYGESEKSCFATFPFLQSSRVWSLFWLLKWSIISACVSQILCQENIVLIFFKENIGVSLVAPWSIVRLSVQETQVQSMVGDDPTCHGATKPMYHNYWACAPEPGNCNCWAACHSCRAGVPWSLGSAAREATAIRSPHATTREKPLLTTTRARPMQQQRPNKVKNQ